ncbi:MAG: zinc ribbon domain-containing protein [Clostridiales bacterium]|nr:zinc ribbon domain-containing protein [Clostridiales bacterium]
MFCNNCGASNPDGTGFCSNCGSALGVAAPQQPVQQPVQQQYVQPAYTQPMNYGNQSNVDYRDNDEIRAGSSCARKALTFGLLSFFFSWTCIFGIIFAAIGLKKASSAKKHGTTGGKVTAGKVFSIIGLIFSLLIVFYYVVAIIGVFTSGVASYTKQAKEAMENERKNMVVEFVDIDNF